jgi:hypothetical protein
MKTPCRRNSSEAHHTTGGIDDSYGADEKELPE